MFPDFGKGFRPWFGHSGVAEEYWTPSKKDLDAK
jgi:hypothetical protein